MSPDIGTSAQPAGTLATTPCPIELPAPEVEGETFSCATYTVPQNWDDPASKPIDLTVLVLKATGANPQPDPLVVLAGGPGQSGVILGALAAQPDVRADRDVILPAQRGTLFSQRLGLEECLQILLEQQPDATLETLFAGVALAGTPDPDASFDAFLAENQQSAGVVNTTCAEAFASRDLDLSQFTTENSARDVSELMQAMGYGEYNLAGISYGTRLALRIATDFPAGIRSVVLDSTAFPSADDILDFVRAPYLATMRVFDDCATDVECAASYPDIGERSLALIDRLKTTPISDEQGPIEAADLALVLQDRTNSRPAFFPLMIAELEQGETGTFRNLQSRQIGLFPPGAPGATPNVQLFLSLLLRYGTTDEDPFGSFTILAAIGEVANESDPLPAIESVLRAALDGAGETSAIALLQRFDAADLAGLLLQFGVGSDATPISAVASTVERSFQLIPYNESRFLQNEINCSETIGDLTPEQALAGLLTLPEPLLGMDPAQLAREFGNCAGMPLANPNPENTALVDLPMPVLVLHGEFDDRLPLASVKEGMRQLPNGQLLIVPGAGHNVWTLKGSCVDVIASRFLDDPAAPLDTSCLALQQIDFVLPVTGSVTPVATPDTD